MFSSSIDTSQHTTLARSEAIEQQLLSSVCVLSMFVSVTATATKKKFKRPVHANNTQQ